MDVERADRGAAGYFGGMTESYDSLIRRAVPYYDEMQRRLVEHLPPAATRVLELGCGTGNLSLALAARYPAAALTLVDGSSEMLAVTRERLAATSPAIHDRLRLVEARFETLALPPAGFDLVTSSISLHHVPDQPALYRALQALLVPGGRLCFADQMRGGDERSHAIHWAHWLEFCRLPGHCTEEEVQSLLDHAEAHDHYSPIASHFRWLEDAGFTAIDCVWRNGLWAIACALRP